MKSNVKENSHSRDIGRPAKLSLDKHEAPSSSMPIISLMSLRAYVFLLRLFALCTGSKPLARC